MISLPISGVAFTIGALSVRWYGIMVALAVLTLIFWALREVRRGADLSYDSIFSAALVGIPSGIIISRLLHVVDNIVVAKLHPELALAGSVFDYTQDPAKIIGGSGLTIWGAVLGAALGIWIYSLFSKKFSLGYLADVLAPGIILAQAIGRVGCTLNGCCYGVETDIFCAIRYTHPGSLGPESFVHPTQIYEIIYNLIVFVILLKLRGRFQPNGSLFLIYLGLYSIWRFGVDFIREGTPFLFSLHQAQVISIIVLIIVITLLAVRRTRWVRRGEESNGD